MSVSAVVCREIFDENSQPSAEEISEYAQQIGIDPVSETHLLPLAKDGLMQALPAPWKAYFDEKVQTHYYYDPETKKTQWEHPLDKVYKELVRKARDASVQDDTCASVQELLTYEENTKILERVEAKVESDDEDLPTDSSRHFDSKHMPKRLAPLGRPPLAPITRFDKKLSDLKVSPLRRSIDYPMKPKFEADAVKPERPKQLFKQHSEIIDLKINVLGSPDDDNFSPLLGTKLSNIERGLPLTGKGSMFFKIPKSDNPSPDTDKSFPLDSMTKSDPPKGILREKIYDSYRRKAESDVIGKERNSASLDDDRKSVRFKLEQLPDPSTISPGSNSSSDQNDGQSSIVTPVPSSHLTLNPVLNPNSVLNPSSIQNSGSILNPISNLKTGPLFLSPIKPRAAPKLDSPKDVIKAFDVIKGMENLKDGNWMALSKDSLVDSDSENTCSAPLIKVQNARSDISIDIEIDSPKILDSSLEGGGDSKLIDVNVDNLDPINDGTDNSKLVNDDEEHDNPEHDTSELAESIALNHQTKDLKLGGAITNSDSKVNETDSSNDNTENSKQEHDNSEHDYSNHNNSEHIEDTALTNQTNSRLKFRDAHNKDTEDNNKVNNSSGVKKVLESQLPTMGVTFTDKMPRTSGSEKGNSLSDETQSRSSNDLRIEDAQAKDTRLEMETDSKRNDSKFVALKISDDIRKETMSKIEDNSQNNNEAQNYNNDTMSGTEDEYSNHEKSGDKLNNKLNTGNNSVEQINPKEENYVNIDVDSPKYSNDPEIKYSESNPKSETENTKEILVPFSKTSIECLKINLQSPRDKSSNDLFESNQSPKRRVLRPPAADYIKSDLFQKNFQKISDLVRPGDIETSSVHLEVEAGEKEVRPRSPLIPQQKNKISINLMESIESETSTESPDKEEANLDLNDLDDIEQDSNSEEESPKNNVNAKNKTAIQDVSNSSHYKSSKEQLGDIVPKISVPKLDLTKPKLQDDKNMDVSKTSSVESRSPKSPQVKSPKFEFSKPWSNSSPVNYKSLNKAVIAPLKPESLTNKGLGKTLTSPRLDGVILSQGKSTDNVVVVYQFETQEDSYPKTIKSPLIDPSRDILERNKADERRRLELNLQKELESIRVEFATRERRMRSELQEELTVAEEKFLEEKKIRLSEIADRHKREMEDAISRLEQSHKESIQAFTQSIEERRERDMVAIERSYADDMIKLEQEYRAKLDTRKEQLEIETERALRELREELKATMNRERLKMIEENKATIEALREDHTNKITDLRHDYRAEVERLRTQHACHLEELRARFASERAAKPEDRGLTDKYKCLKEKYARLKHDVKMSIERRNKRREMSMNTGSETEKSNSHKANQSLERCKELNETSVSAVTESEPKTRINNNLTSKYNDNETSHSESHPVKYDNNNGKDLSAQLQSSVSQSQSSSGKRPRRTTVVFKEPLRPRDRRDKDRDTGATTDYVDSSDATTDDKPKESSTRRRCFTRLKSASTSRLNYSPRRGEGWSSPLEALRQQLRKLDDLEEQFPDLECQPNYTLRYPFGEFGGVSKADTPELEFVRHRTLVEREGMRRARAVLKRRKAALKQTTGEVSPESVQSTRDVTELEVALHRARALLGEKEIRLRHIERALRTFTDPPETLNTPQTVIQEATTSEASSASDGVASANDGAVLRSLRALHADVRDIWRALEVTPTVSPSPDSNSFNPTQSSQHRMAHSAPVNKTQDSSEDGGVAERARGLRAWLQTTP